MKRFIILGAAGYIAPRHMAAIKALGHEIVAIVDPCDQVGVIDRYEITARYYKYLRDVDVKADWCVVCTPNGTHCGLVVEALSRGLDVICEKPLVIHPDFLDRIAEAEKKSGKRVYTMMQLRYSIAYVDMEKFVLSEPFPVIYDVAIEYNAPRGDWFEKSWKGDLDQSGGLLMNIGVHLFDLLIGLFGRPLRSGVTAFDRSSCCGTVNFLRAKVFWRLSIDSSLPAKREVCIDGKSFEISDFPDLHTEAYRHIMLGLGYAVKDVSPVIRLVDGLRRQADYVL